MFPQDDGRQKKKQKLILLLVALRCVVYTSSSIMNSSRICPSQAESELLFSVVSCFRKDIDMLEHVWKKVTEIVR